MDLVTILSVVVFLLAWFIVGGVYLVVQTLGGRSGSRTEWWEYILMAPVFAIASLIKLIA